MAVGEIIELYNTYMYVSVEQVYSVCTTVIYLNRLHIKYCQHTNYPTMHKLLFHIKYEMYRVFEGHSLSCSQSVNHSTSWFISTDSSNNTNKNAISVYSTL